MFNANNVTFNPDISIQKKTNFTFCLYREFIINIRICASLFLIYIILSFYYHKKRMRKNYIKMIIMLKDDINTIFAFITKCANNAAVE